MPIFEIIKVAIFVVLQLIEYRDDYKAIGRAVDVENDYNGSNTDAAWRIDRVTSKHGRHGLKNSTKRWLAETKIQVNKKKGRSWILQQLRR